MAGTNFQSDQPKSLDIETAWRSNTTLRKQIASNSSSFYDRVVHGVAANTGSNRFTSQGRSGRRKHSVALLRLRTGSSRYAPTAGVAGTQQRAYHLVLTDWASADTFGVTSSVTTLYWPGGYAERPLSADRRLLLTSDRLLSRRPTNDPFPAD